MKKLLSCVLIFLLLLSTACAGSEKTVTTTTPLRGDPQNSISDSKTQKIEEILQSYLDTIFVTVRRHTDRDNRLTVSISGSSIEMHKLGQYISDCSEICKFVLEQNQEKLLEFSVLAFYESPYAVSWKTSNYTEGYIIAGGIREIPMDTMKLEKLQQIFSPENKDLPDAKPTQPKDPYEIYDVDKSDIDATLFEMQAFLDRHIKGADYVLVENGRINPEEVFIEVFTTRLASQEFGAIIQDAAAVAQEAMKMTDRKLERFTVTAMLRGEQYKKKSMQWITDDFVSGTAWDDMNQNFHEDGTGIPLKAVVAMYSPSNTTLKKSF